MFYTFERRVFMGFCDLEEVSRMVDFDTAAAASSRMHNTLLSDSALGALYETGSKVVLLDNEGLQ